MLALRLASNACSEATDRRIWCSSLSVYDPSRIISAALLW
jgi:hypothetical protein